MQILNALVGKEKKLYADSTRAQPAAGRRATYSQTLPDLCNLGITVRVLLTVNLAALLLALPSSNTAAGWLARFFQMASVLEPAVLLSIALVCGLRKTLMREQPWVQIAAACTMVGCVSVLCQVAVAVFTGEVPGLWNLWAGAVMGAAVAGAMIAVFAWRAATRRPALAQARLAALAATIRPHFFFNALNAVLGVLRTDPRTAESMLEDLSELFRTLAKSQPVVTLAEEANTARRYLAIEKLRLGERLQVQWQQDENLNEVMIPQLTLQPLLENAVRHGVEPAQEPGAIRVKISRKGREMVIAVDNPLAGVAAQPGLQMALSNIRERLMLLYDLEASLTASERSGRYLVVLKLPVNKQGGQQISLKADQSSNQLDR
jgi:two-component system, LytTR family, sensor histidine kinase AlgZ